MGHDYAPRRLFRLAYDKQIGGVCAGLARYLDMDVTLIRILVAAGAIFSVGTVILAYLFAWAIMPVDYGVRPPVSATPPPVHDPGPAASEQPAV
jgi:phage shock protein PspC (stress-responsive transcriptional regulator)